MVELMRPEPRLLLIMQNILHPIRRRTSVAPNMTLPTENGVALGDYRPKQKKRNWLKSVTGKRIPIKG
jgi:hypothetical protein